MTVAPSYNSLSLRWSPQNKRDHRFNLFATIVLSITLMIGFVFSSVKLPPQERKAYTPVPQRIAQFLTEKQKPKVVKPKPKPKPLPKPVQKPRIKKEAPNKALKNKPITKAMKKARKRAENSGLLALNNELADLMDTSAVSKMVSGRTTKANTTASKLSKDVLTKGTGVGSGGIRGKQNGMAVATTTLSRNELNNFKQSLLAKNSAKKQTHTTSSSSSSSRASVRLEEQVTMVFDQNKSKLYSLYNRARRKNPGLKGKLILQITITAQGIVDRVKVIVSELHDSTLEQRIIARVKQFSFGPSGNETISVTFPIEFIPS